jgi:hypothetical protein
MTLSPLPTQVWIIDIPLVHDTQLESVFSKAGAPQQETPSTTMAAERVTLTPLFRACTRKHASSILGLTFEVVELFLPRHTPHIPTHAG